MILHISQDGSCPFTSVSQALDSIPASCKEPVTLRIRKGIYRERITVSRPYVAFIGDSPSDTVIAGGLYARMTAADGQKLGTFRTYSCFIDTHDVTFRNLTVANTAGKGPDVGQALALYADGDRLFFDNCRFLGGQDTLFTGPLPPKEMEPGGFVGPKQFAPRINGRHYYRNCYLEGDVDFVFGSATAFFEQCEFFSKDIGRPVNGYVTAPSTPEGQDYGYVLWNCRFTGDCPPHSVYLGRPWREYAKAVLIRCHMGEHIFPEGWHDWDKPAAHTAGFFAEYASTGPGADIEARPRWVHRLTDEDLPHYTRERVLGGTDSWAPWEDRTGGCARQNRTDG